MEKYDEIKQAARAHEERSKGASGLVHRPQTAPGPTLSSGVARLRALSERLSASAAQAEASADNLLSTPQKGSAGSTTGDRPQPAGLLDQMNDTINALEMRMDRLGHALDRIDAAHG